LSFSKLHNISKLHGSFPKKGKKEKNKRNIPKKQISISRNLNEAIALFLENAANCRFFLDFRHAHHKL